MAFARGTWAVRSRAILHHLQPSSRRASASAAAAAAKPLPDNQTADHAVYWLGRLAAEQAEGDARPFFLAVGFRGWTSHSLMSLFNGGFFDRFRNRGGMASLADGPDC